MFHLKEIRIHHKEEEVPKNPLPSSLTEIISPQSQESYLEYLKKFKFHFNYSLAEYAVSHLKFKDSSVKPLDYNRVIDLLKDTELELSDNATMGDLYYMVNKIRAIYSGDIIKTDLRVLKMALECLEDPNILEGEILLQWLEHMYRVKKDIIWDKFIE